MIAHKTQKDFGEKAYEGIFVGYSKRPIGWKVYIPSLEKEMTSVFVQFDEKIPERSEEYFKSMKPLVPVDPVAHQVSEYQYLVGTHHIDDEDHLEYLTTRVGVRKGYIVGWRALVRTDGKIKESTVPIHIADIVRLTEASTPATASTKDLNAADRVDRRGDPSSNRVQGDSTSTKPKTEGSVEDRVSDPRLHIRLPTGFDTSEIRAGAEEATNKTQEACTTPVRVTDAARRRCTDRQYNLDPLEENKCNSSVYRRRKKGENLRQLGEALNIEDLAYIQTQLEDAELAPKNYQQVSATPRPELWAESMQKEIDSIIQNGTVEGPVDLPRGKKALRPLWVYKIKRGLPPAEPDMIRKSRLTINGSTQQYGTDYWESYAATAKGASFRLMLVQSLLLSIPVYHIDISNAFLYADLDEEVYMYDWQGGTLPPGKVWRLRKSLYGLKQAPRNWAKHLRRSIVRLGFIQSQCDPCVYVYNENGIFAWMLVYVDDILYGSTDPDLASYIKNKLGEWYKTKFLGEVKRYLGIEVDYHGGSQLRLYQTPYTQEKLKNFEDYVKIVRGGPKKTPLPPDVATLLTVKASPDSEDMRIWVKTFPYREIIDALLYLAVNTRPDIAQAVGMLARHSHAPFYNACLSVCHVLSYLSGTAHLGIVYTQTGEGLDLHAYSDADWAGDLETRRSTAGFIVFGARGPLSWGSKLIKTVCTSSMESEYCAEYYTLQEIVWLRSLLKEIGFPERRKTPVMMDASAAIALSGDPVNHSKAKHIQIKYHWIRQATSEEEGFARLVYVPTEAMTADPTTKQLNIQKTLYHRDRMLGMRKRSSKEDEEAARRAHEERTTQRKRKRT